MFDFNREEYFWGNNYDNNIAYRNLDVERDVPIHGRVTPFADVHRILEQQKGNARALCSQVANAGFPCRAVRWHGINQGENDELTTL